LTLHDSESRQARCDLNLHIDRTGLDPLKGNRRNPLDHAAPTPLPQSKVAEGGELGKNITGTFSGLSSSRSTLPDRPLPLDHVPDLRRDVAAAEARNGAERALQFHATLEEHGRRPNDDGTLPYRSRFSTGEYFADIKPISIAAQ
jgi:hypothetical protein